MSDPMCDVGANPATDDGKEVVLAMGKVRYPGVSHSIILIDSCTILEC